MGGISWDSGAARELAGKVASWLDQLPANGNAVERSLELVKTETAAAAKAAAKLATPARIETAVEVIRVGNRLANFIPSPWTFAKLALEVGIFWGIDRLANPPAPALPPKFHVADPDTLAKSFPHTIAPHFSYVRGEVAPSQSEADRSPIHGAPALHPSALPPALDDKDSKAGPGKISSTPFGEPAHVPHGPKADDDASTRHPAALPDAPQTLKPGTSSSGEHKQVSTPSHPPEFPQFIAEASGEKPPGDGKPPAQGSPTQATPPAPDQSGKPSSDPSSEAATPSSADAAAQGASGSQAAASASKTGAAVPSEGPIPTPEELFKSLSFVRANHWQPLFMDVSARLKKQAWTPGKPVPAGWKESIKAIEKLVKKINRLFEADDANPGKLVSPNERERIGGMARFMGDILFVTTGRDPLLEKTNGRVPAGLERVAYPTQWMLEGGGAYRAPEHAAAINAAAVKQVLEDAIAQDVLFLVDRKVAFLKPEPDMTLQAAADEMNRIAQLQRRVQTTISEGQAPGPHEILKSIEWALAQKYQALAKVTGVAPKDMPPRN